MNRRHLLLIVIVLIAAAVAVAAYLYFFQASDATRPGNLSVLEESAETTRIRPADASIGQLKSRRQHQPHRGSLR